MEAKIEKLGPIDTLTIPIPDAGGVVVLSGANGSGKSHALNAMSSLLGGGDGDLPVNRDAQSGSVEMAGARLTVKKQARRSGVAVAELGVSHIEDRYSLAKLVDPGFKSAESNDAARIKELIRLAGTSIAPGEFGALCPDAYLAERVMEMVRVEDPVASAGKVARFLQERAREAEGKAERKRADAAAARRLADGIESVSEESESTLRGLYAQAIADSATLLKQRDAHRAAKSAKENADARFEQLRGSYTGPTPEAAEEAVRHLQLQQQAAEQQLADLREQERELALSIERRKSLIASAIQTQRAADEHARTIAGFTEAMSAMVPEAPSDEAINQAQSAVKELQARLDELAVNREKVKQAERAKEFDASAAEEEARGQKLREAANATDNLLSKHVSSDSLAVRAGELWYMAGDEPEPFQSLSDGEKWRVVIEIGAKRVGSMGDGTGLLVIEQVAWEGLDPANRQVIIDTAKRCRVVILTAEADAGPLRAKQL